MSRIGKMPVPLPKGVTVDIKGPAVTVKGPKGTLTRAFHKDILIRQEDGTLYVERPSDRQEHRALHGLTRALLANMVQGVSSGYKRELQIEGTGYRAEIQGKNLVLNVGYSHPITFEPPTSEVVFTVDRTGKNISIEGIDKEVVGELAARVRGTRPPEPYKGKGVRYAGERIRRKAGKAGKVG
ncbi:MAG: 50S ribosomal protein L6 [Ardenticatenaceae bacterium]|nr:50S ribosomal protein L6 [Ardenticatenaceae bacterium]